MKKLVLLTSVLALAACGGGSGGSGGGAGIGDVPGIPETPNTPDTPTIEAPVLITETISDTVRASNASVTGIALDNRAELIDMVEQTLGKTYQDEETSAATYSLRAGHGMDNDKRWEWAKGKINHMGWFDKSDEDLLAKLNEYKEQGEAAYNKFINDLKDAFTLIGGSAGDFDSFLDSDDCAGLAGFIAGIIGGDLKDDFEQTKEDMQYKEFDLSGVKFYRGNAHDAGEYIQLKLDNNGEIKQMYMSDAGTFDRSNTNSQFAFHGYRYEVDGHEFMSATKITTDEELRRILQDYSSIEDVSDITLADVEEQEVSYSIDMTTFGRDIGLQYSDFGQILLSANNSSNPGYGMFAGGYDDKKIDVKNIDNATEMMFTGTAIANVKLEEEEKLLAPAEATLTFNPSTQTEELNMSFSDWHDVQITRSGDNDAVFEFSNFTGENEDWAIVGTDVYKQQFETTYYGANGTPTEATAAFGYVEQDRGGTELRFGGAFGGVK